MAIIVYDKCMINTEQPAISWWRRRTATGNDDGSDDDEGGRQEIEEEGSGDNDDNDYLQENFKIDFWTLQLTQ